MSSPAPKYDRRSLITRGTGRAQQLPRRLGVEPEALKGAAILEIGCGFGETTAAVRDLFGAYAFGIDPRPRYELGPWAASDMYRQLTIAGASAFGPQDFVHSYTVWEHIEEPEAALRHLYDLLKPGGRAYLHYNLYLGASASHLLQHLEIPWVHLIHTDEEIRAMTKAKLGKERPASWVNKLSYRNYLAYFDEIGFKVVKHWFDCYPMTDEFFQQHYEKLKGYPREEFNLNFMHVCLERPL